MEISGAVVSKSKNKDSVFAGPVSGQEFKFDEKVAGVFEDMIHRSVPFYDETQAMTLRLAHRFLQSDTCVYDLGCSTGTLLLNFSKSVSDDTVRFIGIDNSEPMLKKASEKFADLPQKNRVEFRHQDLSAGLDIANASIVFMNYTLQFVRPLQRESLLKSIYTGLAPNGCLILVEKVLGNDSLFNRMYIELHHEYKKAQGYSKLEISQKREALENVLVPYRIDENLDLLKRCGFESVDIFFKWYNFAGFLAVKSGTSLSI